MSDIIKVNIDKDEYIKNAGTTLTQWSYGQVLRIIGLDLPETVEIHFSLNDRHGEAPVVLGKTVNGVTDVAIPSFIMEGPECTTSDYYKAYAFIYPSDEESGKTIHKIVLKFKTRPKPADWIPPDQETTLGEVLDMINGKVEKTGHEPNKFLGTDENGNVVTKEQTEYELPVASEDNLGGVEPVTKTEDMTQAVGVDKEGRLFTKPSGIDEATFLKLAIKPTTEEASFHNITDSADYRVLAFATKGKTEQETTTGKNEFDLSKVTRSNSVVLNDTGFNLRTCFGVVVLNSENVLQIFEPSTEYICTLKCNVVDKPDVTNLNTQNSILLLYNHTTAKSCAVAISVTKNDWVEGETYSVYTSFTTPEDLSGFSLLGYTYRDNDSATQVGELEITELMIRKATVTDDNYEPYTGGKPSPNPEFLQPVVNAGKYNEETGRYEVEYKLTGKNLFDISKSEGFVSQYTGITNVIEGNTIIVTNSYTSARTVCLDLGCLKAETYTFSVRTNSIGTFIIKRGTISNSTTITSFSATAGYKTFDLSEDDNVILETFISAGQTLTYQEIQLEYGTAATKHQEHKEQSIILTSERPLTMWDYLDWRDGVWGWSINSIRGYEVTGNETFRMSTNSTPYYTGASTNAYFELSDLAKNKIAYTRYVYCEDLSFVAIVWSLTHGSVGIANNSNQIHMRFPNTLLGVADDATREEKLSAYKAYLQQRYAGGNPVKIQYRTAVEVEFVPLLQEEQDALNALETYYPVTNVSNDQDMPMQITYVADAMNYINRLVTGATASTQALILEN